MPLENQDEELTVLIIDILKKNRRVYEQSKFKVELERLGWIISRRRIGKIMRD